MSSKGTSGQVDPKKIRQSGPGTVVILPGCFELPDTGDSIAYTETSIPAFHRWTGDPVYSQPSVGMMLSLEQKDPEEIVSQVAIRRSGTVNVTLGSPVLTLGCVRLKGIALASISLMASNTFSDGQA